MMTSLTDDVRPGASAGGLSSWCPCIFFTNRKWRAGVLFTMLPLLTDESRFFLLSLRKYVIFCFKLAFFFRRSGDGRRIRFERVAHQLWS